jgi:hypothetical protein
MLSIASSEIAQPFDFPLPLLLQRCRWKGAEEELAMAPNQHKRNRAGNKLVTQTEPRVS